jgi:hypothetical protein
MYVVGAQGDASVWVFQCIGPEAVQAGSDIAASAASQSIDAIKYVREPREPYDADVQIWLDPSRHHLPVRLVQKSGPNDETFELRLKESLID